MIPFGASALTSLQTFHRKPTVLASLGWARSTLYKKIGEQLFPPPVKLGKTSVWPDREVSTIQAAYIANWPESEIRNLVSELVSARKAAL